MKCRHSLRSRLPQFDLLPAAVPAASIRNYLFASLFQASAEALVTENAAPLARMQRAEKSIDDRLAELDAATRTARLSAISKELLEIIARFEVLKARRASSNDTRRGMPAENDGAGT